MSRNIYQSAKIDTTEFQNTQSNQGKILICDICVKLPYMPHQSSNADKTVTKKAIILYSNNRLRAIRIIPRHASRVGEIYIGKIKNITTHPDACFVEISSKQMCYLPMSEVKTPMILNRQGATSVKSGDELLIQITKDAQKNKLCSCSAQISASDNEEYTKLIQTASTRTCFSCIRSIPLLYTQLIGEIATPDEYNEIVTDDSAIYDKISDELNAYKDSIHSIRLYHDDLLSLNRLYGLDSKAQEALERRIWLKSGANLIIEQTEAMTVIDVNSAKKDAHRGNDDEAYMINLEAAEEIALQMRLRNLSGIIIADFINMKEKALEKELLTHFKEMVRLDMVKTKIIDITPLGLGEITRKKVYKPFIEQIMD